MDEDIERLIMCCIAGAKISLSLIFKIVEFDPGNFFRAVYIYQEPPEKFSGFVEPKRGMAIQF